MYCAYSTPVYHSNGYSVRTEGIVAGMRQAGVDIAVVARSGYPWDVATEAPKPERQRWVERRDGVEYVHLPEGNLGNDTPYDYVMIAADSYVREARLRRPSLLHAASNYINGLATLIAARRLGVPFVYEVRGLWEVTEASAKNGWEETNRYVAQAEMESFVSREADAVLAITQEVKDELVRRGVDAAKIALLPNGVNPGAIQPLPADAVHREALDLRDDVPVIGFAGSLVAYEGLDVLLEAACILRERGVGFQVAIAGNAGVYDELTAHVEERALEPNVRFLGRQPAEEMPRVLSCFDIVCCPRRSLPVTEMVSPLKPLEAFAASKPVVLSDVSPHRAIVGEHGERGLLAAPDDPVALADALQLLIEQPERRTAMGRAGRLWTVDDRNWRTLGESLRDVHHRVLAGRAELPGRPLSDLRIALIADEFTTETLQRSATIVPLDVERFEEQLRTEELDLVLLESAWNGNEGQWHRAVGYYSEEEDARIARVFEVCRELGVPTVFWNKEDPVHFQRFKDTAARCDHVFTTDANMIRPYLKTAREMDGGRAVTASSLPFYAQPAIHNPLPGALPTENSFAYAGTYYGERYPERSAQLSKLLRAAQKHGLAVYDRQLAVPDSPYRFPDEFQQDVRGALPYDEVIDSYKAHIASLNVNSVVDSPTMFSRRVVEIAACGGVVLSAWGRGVGETFDGIIPATDNQDYWAALFRAWSTDHEERLTEAWLQMRAVYRSHTVDTALTVLARTAGIAVAGLRLPSYGLELDPEDRGALEAVTTQSVVPHAVVLTGVDFDGDATRRLCEAEIPVIAAGEPRPIEIEWWGSAHAGASRTWAEDLLTATRYGGWDRLLSRPLMAGETGRPLALPLNRPAGSAVDDINGLVRSDLLATHDGNLEGAAAAGPVTGLVLLTPGPAILAPHLPAAAQSAPAGLGTVLVAGHDLKFARVWIEHLQEQGVTVLLDKWADHAHHDEERSRELLGRADTVFCEWGLGNAVWYSKNVRPGQRLIVRVHAQELRRPYLRRIDHAKVSAYVFVGELMRDASVRNHGLPREKTVVVPNYVLTDALDLPKAPGTEHVLGMVGMVPQTKRIDLAVELVERLLERDDRFRLRIKGKRPEDYPWMAGREQEMAYYRSAYKRIDRLNEKTGCEVVTFDGHGDDMPEWYRGIGTAVSLSDLESFHLTLPDGAASGAVPVSLAWPGADLIYPREWLVASLPEMTGRIADLVANPDLRASFTGCARAHTRAAFDRAVVFDRLDSVLAGRVLPDHDGEHCSFPLNVPQLTQLPTPAEQRASEVLAAQSSQLASMQQEIVRIQRKEQTLHTALKQRERQAKDKDDTRVKKIWWLESELRRQREVTDRLAAELDATRATLQNLQDSAMGRIQRSYWRMRQGLR
ncbi:GDP-mannose-dependent alpha-(1-6)-phosphatidylinositol monomannoside mannosyltransferase [Kocuria rosea]|nr:GDP-mannose-dependent alpha-(1-6)-phosphatidylinositol monomannoside mannosyltransferase [Kocuria rosea]